MDFEDKRITIFCGHYGSGKTNIAINYAKYLKEKGHDVVLADLDIVNPYFRSKDSEDELKEAGIEMISLPFAGTNIDLPAIPSEAYSLLQNKDRYAVIDLGGDDRGGYALGRFAEAILEEDNYNCLAVVNFRRPLTPDAEGAAEVMEEVASVTRVPFTGIVNNTNVGEATTAEMVLASKDECTKLCEICGLNVAFTTAEGGVAGELSNSISNLFPIKLQKKPTD